MERVTFLKLILLGTLCVSQSALAEDLERKEKGWGQFNVECGLSHTLPDDPMMAFGKPGASMVHEFFGNRHTDAWTTADLLLADKETTCTARADASAYWAPQLLDSHSGEVIQPVFMKTYYRNTDTRYPVVPFPKGLQLMVGEHVSNGPKKGVFYFCQGVGYSKEVPKSCPLYQSGTTEKVQFNLAFDFPNCWDGVNLKPPHHGPRNAVYDIDGRCPADYPVKIPQLQFNLEYKLPGVIPLERLRLSMNPEMEGGKLTPRWGSLYTAHADFFNGWPEDVLAYAVDYCLNQNWGCNKALPTYSVAASGDSYTRGGIYSAENYGHATQAFILRGKGLAPEDRKTAYIKFPLPEESEAKQTNYIDIAISFYAQNAEKSTEHMLYFYEAASDWDEYRLSADEAASCGGSYIARAWMSHNGRPMYRNTESIAKVIQKAWQRGDKEVAFCVMTDGNNIETVLGTRESGLPAFLFFTGHQKMTSPGLDRAATTAAGAESNAVPAGEAEEQQPVSDENPHYSL
ncbi:DUF1996 domain-containing protein [Serratia sp. AKBS12]|uniref:DUF1996 domain-containing protein n=1 Tax=Serratia sp. AKBS12 TaxID=2974597 RepID=UPI0021655C97|nr:DUF1996 domain-containing protein [Serratia sp. AKBS12]MCS3409164.1 DUF1996 domain-containing protein [Serratia sp. AKBS12]